MKHLFILFTAALLLGCNQQGTQNIQGEWMVTEYYDDNQDYSYLLTPDTDWIIFGDEIIADDRFYGVTQGNYWLGNQGHYVIEDNVMYDSWGARFTVEWQTNNRVKLVSLIHTGRHLILER